MHAGSVLSFDDRSFPADDLDRIEEAVPYAYADKRKTAAQCAFLADEHSAADCKGHKYGDQCSHRQCLPVILVNEHSEQFAEVNADLRNPARISDIAVHARIPPLLPLYGLLCLSVRYCLLLAGCFVSGAI